MNCAATRTALMSGNLLRTLEDEAEQLARVNASLRADVAGLERAARAKDAALMAQAAELDELRLQHEGAAHAAEQRRAELERGDPKLRAHAAALAKQLRKLLLPLCIFSTEGGLLYLFLFLFSLLHSLSSWVTTILLRRLFGVFSLFLP